MFPGEIASRAMVDLHFSAGTTKNSLKPSRFFPAAAEIKLIKETESKTLVFSCTLASLSKVGSNERIYLSFPKWPH